MEKAKANGLKICEKPTLFFLSKPKSLELPNEQF